MYEWWWAEEIRLMGHFTNYTHIQSSHGIPETNMKISISIKHIPQFIKEQKYLTTLWTLSHPGMQKHSLALTGIWMINSARRTCCLQEPLRAQTSPDPGRCCLCALYGPTFTAPEWKQPFWSRKNAQTHILLAIRAVASHIMWFLENSVGHMQENENNTGKNMF